MNNEVQKYWLALLRVPGVGAKKARGLLEHFSAIGEIFSASRQVLVKMGLSDAAIDGILYPNQQLIEQDTQWLMETNHHLVTIMSNDYPVLLHEISSPPLALFIAGDPKILQNPQISIVGSRNPTVAGMDNAHEFAASLAKGGITITSGLALGIDSASHKGALSVDGVTVAVMGTGMDKVYPAENQQLARQIVQTGGAVVSEYSMAAPVKPENFPRRNRIISGLSMGTLVVEATVRSGSLITASRALEQGREVFAIPGSIHNPQARGCNQLIRQGAKLVETAQDIIEEIGGLFMANYAVSEQKLAHHSPGALPRNNKILDNEHNKLLDYVNDEAAPVDLLVARSGLSANIVSSMLLVLELDGFVKSTPGGYVKLRCE